MNLINITLLPLQNLLRHQIDGLRAKRPFHLIALCCGSCKDVRYVFKCVKPCFSEKPKKCAQPSIDSDKKGWHTDFRGIFNAMPSNYLEITATFFEKEKRLFRDWYKTFRQSLLGVLQETYFWMKWTKAALSIFNEITDERNAALLAHNKDANWL